MRTGAAPVVLRRAGPRAPPGASARTPRRTVVPTRARSGLRRADRRQPRRDARAGGPRRTRESCRRVPLRAASAPGPDAGALRASCPALMRALSSRSRSRSLSSPAAFSVNVTATMSRTSALPSAMMRTIRPTSAVVLPVPAAASTMSVVVERSGDELARLGIGRASGSGTREPERSLVVMAFLAAPSGRRAVPQPCARRVSARRVRRSIESRTTCRPGRQGPRAESRARSRGR